MSYFKELLKSNEFLLRLGKAVKSIFFITRDELNKRRWLRQRKIIIDDYLQNHSVAKLHIGSGPMDLTGWLNTDLKPRPEQDIIFLDITEPLPFANDSLDYIYSEHLIEHVDLINGISHLQECHRVLKKGGVIRVATPALEFLLDYFSGDINEVQRGYMTRLVDDNAPGLNHYDPCMVINYFVRDWGHQFIYSRTMLNFCLKKVGFDAPNECQIGKSSIADLNGLERHGGAITEDFNKLQTMVFEAMK